MPIYEYECIKCGHIDEILTLSTEHTVESMTCSKCGNFAHKVMSINSFRLIGDGWYKTATKEKNDGRDS